MLDVANVTLPSEYTFKELLDETLDSINVLALDKKNDLFSIRIFHNDKSPNSEKLISTIKKWNSDFRPKNNELYNRILVFQTKDENGNYYCWHKFMPRTLEFLCFYGDDVFDEEKDAICLQLVDLLEIVKDYELLPIFPSRIVLNDDLYVQLLDLYPPNPIDEEAFQMGWFQEDATNELLITRIIALLWKIDDDLAKEKLNDYRNGTGCCPKWSKEFLLLHMSDTSTIRKSNIPPLLALDLVRSKVNSGVRSTDHYAACYGITEMIYLVSNLTEQMIKVRVLPITLDLFKVKHDITKSLLLLLILQILDKISFEKSTSAMDQNRQILDMPTFMEFIKSIIFSEYHVAQYTLLCVLPRVIHHITEEEARTLIIKLISVIKLPENEFLKVVFCLNFHRIMESLKDLTPNRRISAVKPFICQLLSIKMSHVQDTQLSGLTIVSNKFTTFNNNLTGSEQLAEKSKTIDEFLFKTSDQLLQSLLNMPPEYYNVDSIVERIPSQLMTQTQLRYLIKNVKNASPSLLFKFNVTAALPLSHLSSLSQTFIRKLKTVVHPADFSVLIPADSENFFLQHPSSPQPVEDNMLEIIRPFITTQLIEYDKFYNKPIPKRRPSSIIKPHQTVNTILELGVPINDFTFTVDGKNIIVCNDNNVLRYNSNLSSTDYTVLFNTKENIEKVVAFRDSFVVSGSEGPQRFGIMRFYFDNKVARNQSYSYDSPITALSRFESNDYLFYGLKNGDVYFNTPLSQKSSIHLLHINTNLGSPMSIVEMPNSSNFIISTDEGNVIIYDKRIQTPIKRFRPSNRPGYVVPYDSSLFWITCGPFCAKIHIGTLEIKQAISVASSHVVCCCPVGDFVITAHTDLSVFAVNDNNKVYNMNSPNSLFSFRRQSNQIIINPNNNAPLHEHPINCIRPSPNVQTVVSSDPSGRLIMWATPNLNHFK